MQAVQHAGITVMYAQICKMVSGTGKGSLPFLHDAKQVAGKTLPS
jgi:hypothetical protein